MARTTVFRLAARGTVIALLALVGAVLAPAGAASAAAPNPVVANPPVPGLKGYPLWDSWFELGPLGYEEHEYFISGTATLPNGTSPAPYTTRIIVTRPSTAADWNGAVLLDWTNVTAQFENAVDTVEAHEYLLREGWATVHVSAQSAGICCTPLTPKIWDPQRYASLNHPGDNYANSMFSQIAQAIDSPVGIDPLGGLPTPRRIIAAGQSQSAGKLDNYVRNAQAGAGIIDGFLIHGGGSRTWPAGLPGVPVFHLQSDAEASPAAAATSGPNYNLWEVAGSAHSDFWIGYHQEVGQGPRFAGAPKQPAAAETDIHEIAGNYGEIVHPMQATCILAGATFPMRYATSAALHHLDRWIQTGTPPPTAPRFQMSGSSLARDADQNALGGLRLPPIDVPVARYLSDDCVLGGLTVPFTEAELRTRYATHSVYYAQMQARTADSVAAGYLLPEDAVDLLARACAAKVRWQELPGPCGAEPVVPEAPLVLLLPLTALAAFAALAARRRRRT